MIKGQVNASENIEPVMLISQSWGNRVGHHSYIIGEKAIREIKLRRICLCVEIVFELLSKRGNSG